MGAPLLAVNRSSPAHVRTLGQDSRSAHGLLYLAAVRPISVGKNTVKPVLTSDHQLENWLVMLCRPQYLQFRACSPCP
jgi:hypothetical protein